MGLETRTRAADATETVRAPRTSTEVFAGAGTPTQADILGIQPATLAAGSLRHDERDPPAFMPTSGMVQVKATFWTMVSVDTSLVPDRMGKEQIVAVLGDQRLTNWFKKKGFKDWFLNKHEHAAKEVALYDRWLFLVEDWMWNRSDEIQFKDLDKIGKTLAELARRMPERWMKEKIIDGQVGKMDNEGMVNLLLTTAKSLGWVVTIPAGAPGADMLEAGQSGEKES